MVKATDIASKKPRFILYKKIEKKIEFVFKIFAYISAVLIALMMFMTTYHVFGRYFFNAPVPGLTELSGFFITICIFFMIPHVMIQGGHVAVGILGTRLTRVPKVIFDSILMIVGLGFTAICCFATYKEGLSLIERHTVSPLLHAPYYWFTMIVSIGWGLLAIAIIFFVINMILKVVENE